MKRAFNPARRMVGFTLVELLVVVAIIAVLIALLLPSLARAKQQAVSVACLANLRGWGQMNQEYTTENNDVIPSYYWEFYNDDISQLGVLASWESTDEGVPMRGGSMNWGTVKKIYKSAYCPADEITVTPTYDHTTYNFNNNVFGDDAPYVNPLTKMSEFNRPSDIITVGDETQYSSISNYSWFQFNFPSNEAGHAGCGPTVKLPVTGNVDTASGPSMLRYRHFDGYGPQSQTVANAVFLDGHAESIKYGTLTMGMVDNSFQK